MIATHLELGQLWRCPITWCAVWKGLGRACLEHLAEKHGGSALRITTNVAQFSPHGQWLGKFGMMHRGLPWTPCGAGRITDNYAGFWSATSSSISFIPISWEWWRDGRGRHMCAVRWTLIVDICTDSSGFTKHSGRKGRAGVSRRPLLDSLSEAIPTVGYTDMPLPSVDNSVMPELVWMPPVPRRQYLMLCYLCGLV